MNEIEAAKEILAVLDRFTDDKQKRVILALVRTVLSKGEFATDRGW